MIQSDRKRPSSLPADTGLFGEARQRLTTDCQRLRARGLALPDVRLTFDLRGTRAGKAIMRHDASPLIRLNATLLAENGHAFLSQTLPHELAHVAVFHLLGRQPRRPHGREWRNMMRALGAEPVRCHQFDVSNARLRRLRTYRYTCACDQHELSSIRHHRVQRGVRYVCGKCRTVLREFPLAETGGTSQTGHN